jgi:cyclophilin family peptidyl-prolyl cis-trans isomerase
MGRSVFVRAGQLSALLGAALAIACGAQDAPSAPEPPDEPSAQVLDGPHPIAQLDLGELGEVQIQLLPEIAPKTVARFAELANEGFYDGTTFHRVIPGFMIQGGDPLTRNADPRDDGKGGSPDIIPDDYSDLPMLRGSVAMANRGSPQSAQGQFFIVHADSRKLDGKYTIFGRVLEGIDVIDAVTDLEIDTYGRFGPPDRPYPVDARIASLRVVGP